MTKTVQRPHAVKHLRSSQCAVTGHVLHSIEVRYWRAIHSELMTHRVFSRNAGSSRAIPVRKVLSQVWHNPAGPIHWGANQSGMQARAELVGWKRAAAGALWRLAGKVMCCFAWGMMKLNLHKQVANRLLEPWQFINVVISSTEWQNFFALRCHPDAQPEFQELAKDIYFVLSTVEPDILQPGEWHMIYVTDEERATLPLHVQLMVSTARAARVSYEPFDGNANISKEIERHNLLVGSTPIHASPTEHQAVCLGRTERHGNFWGFRQYREFVAGSTTETLK